MKTFVLLLLLYVGATSASAAEFETSLTDLEGNYSYPAIEFMSAGESWALPMTGDVEALPPETPQAATLRVVVYRSEIYQSLAIETVTTGLEGCCSTVSKVGLLDLEAFAKHFGFRGEVSGFVFSGWTTPRSFRFTYKGEPFHAAVSESGLVRVARQQGAN